jgi:hypothetical protein
MSYFIFLPRFYLFNLLIYILFLLAFSSFFAGSTSTPLSRERERGSSSSDSWSTSKKQVWKFGLGCLVQRKPRGQFF